MTCTSIHYPSHYINSQWVQAQSPETLPVYDSSTAASVQVDINGGPFNASAPFGGYKQPGNGRGNGVYGFEEFLELKSFQLKTAAV